MADTSNLSNFLGDVADAIRTKKGTTETIPAANFDTEIASIETGTDTSDATATADDILAGTTAYIVDGKVEGNIQKIEEALDDTITAGTLDEYNNYDNIYCERHNLLFANGTIKNIVTGETSSRTNIHVYAVSFLDDADGNIRAFYYDYVSKNYGVKIYIINPKTLEVVNEQFVPLSNSYPVGILAVNPDDAKSCYVYNGGNLYLCGDTAVKLCSGITLDSSSVNDATYTTTQLNASKSKILIQSFHPDGNYWTYMRQYVYDIANNKLFTLANDSFWQVPVRNCPFTWYDDDTLLLNNNVCEVTSSGYNVIKTLTGLNNINARMRYHYKDTNMFVSVYDSGAVVVQTIDYKNDLVISEQTARTVGNTYNCVTEYDKGIIAVGGIYNSSTSSYTWLCDTFKVGSVFSVTGLIRKGTPYHDTSRGTALAGHVLKGYTAFSSNGKLIGAMPNNGAINITPSTEAQSIPAGYTSGGTVGAIDYSNTLSPTEYDNCLQLSNSILNGTKPYVELAYIESSGTQYINTEYKAGINTKIMMSVMTTDSRISSGLFVQITGAKNSYHSSSAIQVAHGLNDNMVIIDYGTGGSNNQQIIPRNTKIDIIVGNNVSSVNGQMYSQTGSFSGTCSYPLWIFDCNDAGSHEQYYIGRVYYYKIYENDTLVRDFIPVKNILNNEICLYDKIESKFYYNSGSGNFIGGGN